MAALHSAQPEAFGATLQEEEQEERLESASLNFPLKTLPRDLLALPQEERPQPASASTAKQTDKTAATATTNKFFITLPFLRTKAHRDTQTNG